MASRCRRGDFAGVSVGSNPQQPTISRTPRHVGGDRPSADGHVKLLSSSAEYPARPMRSAWEPRRLPSRCSGSPLFGPATRPRLPERGGRSPTAEAGVLRCGETRLAGIIPHRRKGRSSAALPVAAPMLSARLFRPWVTPSAGSTSAVTPYQGATPSSAPTAVVVRWAASTTDGRRCYGALGKGRSARPLRRPWTGLRRVYYRRPAGATSMAELVQPPLPHATRPVQEMAPTNPTRSRRPNAGTEQRPRTPSR
jgi:hypothetical protein